MLLDIIVQCVQRACVTILRLRPNGPHFTNDIFKFYFFFEKICSLINISLKFVRMAPLTISRYWFKWWIGDEQTTSQYMDQWWFVLLARVCEIYLRWVKTITLNTTEQRITIPRSYLTQRTAWSPDAVYGYFRKRIFRIIYHDIRKKKTYQLLRCYLMRPLSKQTKLKIK